MLADAYLAAGRHREGLQAIISSFCCPDDVWSLPEQEAEAYLLRAIEEARARGSMAIELRAARSLAQLLQRQGRAAEVRGTPIGLLDGFTEGDALPDLRQVRTIPPSLPRARQRRRPLWRTCR